MFYFTAALVGMVLGGIQALSRATYSKLLLRQNADQDLTSYFSLYDVLYKLSIVSGTLIFGVVYQLTGQYEVFCAGPGLSLFKQYIFIAKVNITAKDQNVKCVKREIRPKTLLFACFSTHPNMDLTWFDHLFFFLLESSSLPWPSCLRTGCRRR